MNAFIRIFWQKSAAAGPPMQYKQPLTALNIKRNNSVIIQDEVWQALFSVQRHHGLQYHWCTALISVSDVTASTVEQRS